MNGNQTNLFALSHLIVDHFADSFGNRTHSDDDVFCIGSTIVSERFVFATGNLRDFLHIIGYDIGHCIVD